MKRQCTAWTTAGEPCTRPARKGTYACGIHRAFALPRSSTWDRRRHEAGYAAGWAAACREAAEIMVRRIA